MYNISQNSLELKIKIRIASSFKSIFSSKLAFSIIFAAAMVLSANIFIYLPGTPVPITLQTITVLLSGLFLGSRFAMLSQIEYVLLGMMGLPVFAGFKTGVFSLLGPTGGYILGFIFAAFAAGYIFENFGSIVKNKIYLSFFSFMAGLIIIYMTGFIHLLSYTSGIYGNIGFSSLLITTFNIAVKPFILIEFIKLFIIMDAAVLIKSSSRLRHFYKKLSSDW